MRSGFSKTTWISVLSVLRDPFALAVKYDGEVGGHGLLPPFCWDQDDPKKAYGSVKLRPWPDYFRGDCTPNTAGYYCDEPRCWDDFGVKRPQCQADATMLDRSKSIRAVLQAIPLLMNKAGVKNWAQQGPAPCYPCTAAGPAPCWASSGAGIMLERTILSLS